VDIDLFVAEEVVAIEGGGSKKKKPKQKLTRLGARVPLYRSRTNERHQARKTNTTSTKRYSISTLFNLTLYLDIMYHGSRSRPDSHLRKKCHFICIHSVAWLTLFTIFFYLYFVRIDRHMRIQFFFSISSSFFLAVTQVPLANTKVHSRLFDQLTNDTIVTTTAVHSFHSQLCLFIRPFVSITGYNVPFSYCLSN